MGHLKFLRPTTKSQSKLREVTNSQLTGAASQWRAHTRLRSQWHLHIKTKERVHEAVEGLCGREMSAWRSEFKRGTLTAILGDLFVGLPVDHRAAGEWV